MRLGVKWLGMAHQRLGVFASSASPSSSPLSSSLPFPVRQQAARLGGNSPGAIRVERVRGRMQAFEAKCATWQSRDAERIGAIAAERRKVYACRCGGGCWSGHRRILTGHHAVALENVKQGEVSPPMLLYSLPLSIRRGGDRARRCHTTCSYSSHEGAAAVAELDIPSREERSLGLTWPFGTTGLLLQIREGLHALRGSNGKRR